MVGMLYVSFMVFVVAPCLQRKLWPLDQTVVSRPPVGRAYKHCSSRLFSYSYSLQKIRTIGAYILLATTYRPYMSERWPLVISQNVKRAEVTLRGIVTLHIAGWRGRQLFLKEWQADQGPFRCVQMCTSWTGMTWVRSICTVAMMWHLLHKSWIKDIVESIRGKWFLLGIRRYKVSLTGL